METREKTQNPEKMWERKEIMAADRHRQEAASKTLAKVQNLQPRRPNQQKQRVNHLLKIQKKAPQKQKKLYTHRIL